jgi:hypothetical protein
MISLRIITLINDLQTYLYKGGCRKAGEDRAGATFLGDATRSLGDFDAHEMRTVVRPNATVIRKFGDVPEDLGAL